MSAAAGSAPGMARLWPYAAVGGAFGASRLLYALAYDLRFDLSPITYFVQYANPWFLEHDLARSVWHLHHQAPAQNLLAGFALKALGEGDAALALGALYTGIGLLVVLGALHAMLRLGAAPIVAVIACGLYAASPGTALYEQWFFYHLPVAACLVLSLVALIRLYRTGGGAAAHAFFACIAAAALFRSIYGPLFLAAALAVLLAAPPPADGGPRAARRRLALAAVGPLLLLVALALKPPLQIGCAYGEAILWGNLTTKILRAMPAAERRALAAEKRLSPAAYLPCFADLRRYGAARLPHPPTGVPLLDRERAPDGARNAHAVEYALIARERQRRDAAWLLRHHPEDYAASVGSAFARYAAPVTEDQVLSKTRNARKLRRVIEAADRSWCRAEAGWLPPLAFGLPAIALGAGLLIWRGRRRGAAARAEVVGSAYALLAISYVTAVAVLVSYGDFSRYRYEVDPLYLVLAALLISGGGRYLWRRVRAAAARRAGRSRPPGRLPRGSSALARVSAPPPAC